MVNEKKPYIIDGKHVESTGESLNTFVNIATDEKIERNKKKRINS